MCLPVAAALSSSEVSGAAFKLYACYCAHRDGFEVSIKSEQIHAETGIGLAYISTLKFELFKAGWIGLSNKTAKGIVPLKGFEVPAEHIRTERKLSKIERTSDKKASNIERKSGEVSKIESSVEPPEKLSKIERILSDEVSNIERNSAQSFENQKKNPGTPIAPLSAETISTDNTPPSPSAQEGGADAPPPRPAKKKAAKAPSAMSKLSDPERTILELWRELAKAYPPEYAWPTIFERILDGFDAARFKRCGSAYLTYFSKGQRHVGGILDWYVNNQTEPERNGNGKVATARFGKPEITRDFSRFPRRAG